MGIVFLSLLLTAMLIFIGLFFLFRKKNSNKNPLSNLYFWITAIVAIPCFYIGLLFFWFLVSSSYESKEFDTENWADNRDSRYVYVDDLIDGQKLIGITSSEIKSMLGETDYEDDSTMRFYIGYSPKTFLNMNPDWLEIVFIDGKVSKAYVRE